MVVVLHCSYLVVLYFPCCRRPAGVKDGFKSICIIGVLSISYLGRPGTPHFVRVYCLPSTLVVMSSLSNSSWIIVFEVNVVANVIRFSLKHVRWNSLLMIANLPIVSTPSMRVPSLSGIIIS